MKTPNLEQTIDRMKSEIIADIKNGIVPKTCASFSELHNYVDANCYGGFCDDDFANALIEHFGGRDENEGMPDGMMKYINDAQDAINTWLQSNRV